LVDVVLLSPVPALRAGLLALLGAALPARQAAGSAGVADAAARLEELSAPLPDGCVLVVTPGGLNLNQELPAGSLPAALLWIESETADPAETLRALQAAGARLGLRAWGLLTIDVGAGALHAAVQALAEGLCVFPPETALLPAVAGRPAVDELLEPLTPREIEVLRVMADGLTNKQAARALGISEHTVKFHVTAIYAKLGVNNRAEAVRVGARLGWVPL
jgi:DNA-binding NarL/FixJ family response regulator